ncbi:MAG: hypothetical protein WCY29_02450 [Novosphingobium sp.]
MIYALLLFGCADDGSQCVQLSVAARHYEARIICEAEAELALGSDAALRADHPSVEARCVPVSRAGRLA